MNLIEHAKKELELAGLFSKDSDYGGLIGKNVMELMELFSNQGHSGESASIVSEIFNKLSRYKPICPLTLKDDEWSEYAPGQYQNIRNGSVFKDGKYGRPYFLNAYTKVKKDSGSCWCGNILMSDGRYLKRCYPKDINNLPTIRITPEFVYHSKEGSDWDFLPLDYIHLKELSKYYDLEII